MRVGVIEAVWEGTPFEGRRGFELAKEIGFESIDLSRDPLDSSQRDLARVAGELAAAGLPVASVVCVALGVADFHPAVQRFHVDRAKRHVELAADLGASNLLLVIGDYVWRGEVIPRDEQWGMAVRNAREIAEHGARHGVEVALELEPFQYAPCAGDCARRVAARSTRRSGKARGCRPASPRTNRRACASGRALPCCGAPAPCGCDSACVAGCPVGRSSS
jgi:sugar phosphate isomerase/epimerase